MKNYQGDPNLSILCASLIHFSKVLNVTNHVVRSSVQMYIVSQVGVPLPALHIEYPFFGLLYLWGFFSKPLEEGMFTISYIF